MSRDDLSAITWIDKTLPADVKILIASSRLYVTSFEPTQAQTGSDAGIWITPLIFRETIILADLNFETEESHTQICSQNIDYVYIGSMPQSFNEIQLASQPNWYQPIFMLPHARVYQVFGCK
ncbi:MAG: hypothetical protein HC797_00765 [Anaerolineales bacterium]|nr:hypothetical protein [Anaerolineales bacterium]